MKTLLMAIASTTTLVFANPIVVDLPSMEMEIMKKVEKVEKVEKTWERCAISAGEKSSTVSCAVGYKGKKSLNTPFSVSVPVILPESLAKDPAKVASAIKARLEIGGKLYEPHHVTFGNDPLLPPGTVKADCEFLIPVPGKSFALVASYEQPTIKGKVYYLPQFEAGKNPRDFAEFSVSVFPTDGGLLALESKHKQEATSFATRVTVKPVHNEIIKIGYSRSESGPRD